MQRGKNSGSYEGKPVICQYVAGRVEEIRYTYQLKAEKTIAATPQL